MTILPQPHPLPCFRTPCISIFHQKIRSKTSIDQITGRYLISFVFPLLYRQIELFCLCYYITIFTIFTIRTLNIAMLTPCTKLMTAVPRIPHRRLYTYSSHLLLPLFFMFYSCAVARGILY